MSGGQHVGGVSDNLNDEDSELRNAMRERMKIKPTGKVFRGVSDIGDGDMCPVPGHGRKLRLNSPGHPQWCPNQSHDNERMVRGA